MEWQTEVVFAGKGSVSPSDDARPSSRGPRVIAFFREDHLRRLTTPNIMGGGDGVGGICSVMGDNSNVISPLRPVLGPREGNAGRRRGAK